MIKELREETGAGVLDCKKALETTGGDFDKAVSHLREKGLDAAAKKASREARDGLVNVLVNEAGSMGTIVEVNCETDFVARTDDFKALVGAIARQVAGEAEVMEVSALLNRPYIDDQSVTLSERLTQLVAKLGENMVVRRFDRVQRDGSGLVEGYLHLGSRIGVILHMSTENNEVADSAAFQNLIHDLALQIAASAPRYISSDDVPASTVEAEEAKYWAQLENENKPDHIKERIVTGRLGKWYEQICLMRQPFVKDDSVTISDLITQKSKELDAPLVVDQFVRYELGEDE
jgi:elongation factor Ts